MSCSAARGGSSLDDTQSQVDHNAVISWTSARNLFATEHDARIYAQKVLDRYADDRPIIALSFFPTSKAELRQ